MLLQWYYYHVVLAIPHIGNSNCSKYLYLTHNLIIILCLITRIILYYIAKTTSYCNL